MISNDCHAWNLTAKWGFSRLKKLPDHVVQAEKEDSTPPPADSSTAAQQRSCAARHEVTPFLLYTAIYSMTHVEV